MVNKRHKKFGDTYRLIFMDYSMPVCSGPEATEGIIRYLKNNCPDVRKPYICCIPAYKDNNFKVKALAAGMDTFIDKFVTKQ